MLIKAVRTGRKTFGQTVDPIETMVTIAGVRLRLTESDSWSSGEYAGDGEYIRCTFLDSLQPIDPWPNLKGVKA